MIDHDPYHPDSTERWLDDALTSLRNQIIARDSEIARLRKALTFYADTKRYQYAGWQGDMNAPSVMADTGHHARAVLKDDT